MCGREWSLGVFEVLTRRSQSALEWSRRTVSPPVQPPRLFTIPPRQRLPVTRRLAIRARRVISIIFIRFRIRIRFRIIINVAHLLENTYTYPKHNNLSFKNTQRAELPNNERAQKQKARQNLNAMRLNMRALSSPLLSLSSSSSSSRKNNRATAKTPFSSSPRSFLPSRVTVLRTRNSTRQSSLSSFSVKASSSDEENKEIQVTLVDCFTSDVGKMTSETRKNAEESIMELENARFVSEKYLFANAEYIFFLFFERERGKYGFLEESGRRRLFVVCLFVFFLRVFCLFLASFSRVSYSGRVLFARCD